MAKNERDNNPAVDRDNGSPAVVWQLSGDALTPSKAPWGFIARNPVQRNIPPGGKVQIDLQIEANVPMLVFPVRSHQDEIEVNGQKGCVILQAGTNLTITVENRSAAYPMLIDDREGLVCLHPLLFSGLAGVG